jgi:pyruvate-formate lyase-activating enzyme
MQNIRATLEMLYESKDKLDIEIRTTVVPSLLFRKEDILEIAKVVNDLEARWVLQRFDNQQEMADKNMQNINPPSMAFLDDVKDACIRQYPKIRIDVR